MTLSKNTRQLLITIVGIVIYVLGVNLFIVPLDLYTGGLMGLSQLIRTIISDYLHVNIGFDFAGLIYYAFNIPIFIYAYKNVGKFMLIRSFISATLMTVLLSVVPIPASTPLGDDLLASCMIGAILSGAGIGLTLQNGFPGGGLDLLGLILTQKKNNFSVGKLYTFVNILLYGGCLLLFDTSIVIYSIIVAMVSSIAMDKVHYQNIMMNVQIISKSFSEEMKQEIMGTLGRGITVLPGTGAYTGEPVEVLDMFLSKYEMTELKRIVYKHDPSAFVVTMEGVHVTGNYIHKI